MSAVEHCVARVIGFAVDNCKSCHGTGRTGFSNFKGGQVITCLCVSFFDIDRIRGEAEVSQAMKEVAEKQVAKN